MNRKKIEIEKGSIAPVQRTLWSAAIEKLQEARAGLAQVSSATDRIAFEQGWTRAVDSLVQFWVRFYDEGASRFSNFQPWAGQQEKKWKSDETLMYLYQARHISQHGRFMFEWGAGKLKIAPNFNRHVKTLSVFTDGTFTMSATNLAGAPEGATVRFVGGQAILPVIVNKREQQEYPPPMVFEGGSYRQLSPAETVKAGIDYYQALLEAALKKFGSYT